MDKLNQAIQSLDARFLTAHWVIAIASFAALGYAFGQPPLLRAHAHNDYAHQRPLDDALEQGFCNVEADIFLVDGELLVGHTRFDLRPSRTLKSLYLDPLRAKIKQHAGHVFPNSPLFTLMIDVKTEATPTFVALHRELLEYRDILCEFSDNHWTERPVRVVVSGNRDYAAIEREPIRMAGIDGRVGDLDSNLSNTLMPWISDSWQSQFSWNGIGEFPAEQREKLHNLVTQAHSKGKQIRFWATPESEALWKELWDAQVDLINTDQLERLRKWIEEQH